MWTFSCFLFSKQAQSCWLRIDKSYWHLCVKMKKYLLISIFHFKLDSCATVFYLDIEVIVWHILKKLAGVRKKWKMKGCLTLKAENAYDRNVSRWNVECIWWWTKNIIIKVVMETSQAVADLLVTFWIEISFFLTLIDLYVIKVLECSLRFLVLMLQFSQLLLHFFYIDLISFAT